MRRMFLLSLLLAQAASAQRGIVGLPQAPGGNPGCCVNGHFPHGGGFPSRGHLAFPYYPFWYDGETNTSVSTTASVVTPPPARPPSPPAQPSSPPAKAQVIEVPEQENATATRPHPLTVFVLKDGTRIHAQRYLLTTEALSVHVGQQERRFPFGTIDVDATLAANRAQGVSLHIPADRGEVAVSF